MIFLSFFSDLLWRSDICRDFYSFKWSKSITFFSKKSLWLGQGHHKYSQWFQNSCIINNQFFSIFLQTHFLLRLLDAMICGCVFRWMSKHHNNVLMQSFIKHQSSYVGKMPNIISGGNTSINIKGTIFSAMDLSIIPEIASQFF